MSNNCRLGFIILGDIESIDKLRAEIHNLMVEFGVELIDERSGSNKLSLKTHDF